MAVTSKGWDRSASNPGMVLWQSRRIRRAAPQISGAAIVLGVLALLGGTAGAGQMLGLLHWTGPLAFIPAALILIAVSAPLIAAARAAGRWLGG